MGFVSAVLAMEVCFIAGIIFYVPYTEIDWKAYMEEVNGFLHGQLDYTKLRGGTGPLVYPGGFVWLYSALYYITRGGKDIVLAQWIFAGVYWAFLALALSLYYRCGLQRPWRAFASLLLSKRIRSLFVLRLFNDCWAMLLAYLAISYLAERRRRRLRWVAGCALYTIAVSVKMNVLLFAPGLLYVLLRSLALHKVAGCLALCAAWQLLVGYPFLISSPRQYIDRAFELGRVFTQRWSVNLRFLPPEVFVDPLLGKGLLAATVVAWLLLWRLRWRHRTYAFPKTVTKRGRSTRARGGAEEVAGEGEEEEEQRRDDVVFRAVVLTLLESNLVGVALARSLHYQFYTWFFYSVPLVLYYTKFPAIVSVGVFALIRQGFESYPSTAQSSMLVTAGFALVLGATVFLGNDAGRGAPGAASGGTKEKPTRTAPVTPAPATAAEASAKKTQ